MRKVIANGKEGFFHGWGSNYDEFESGPGNYSIAIVEFDDGTIKSIPVEKIRFIKSLEVKDGR